MLVEINAGLGMGVWNGNATNFTRTFYKTLKDGQPVDRALTLARQEAWKACGERSDSSETLPSSMPGSYNLAPLLMA
jgi:hypothetical protein